MNRAKNMVTKPVDVNVHTMMHKPGMHPMAHAVAGKQASKTETPTITHEKAMGILKMARVDKKVLDIPELSKRLGEDKLADLAGVIYRCLKDGTLPRNFKDDGSIDIDPEMFASIERSVIGGSSPRQHDIFSRIEIKHI